MTYLTDYCPLADLKAHLRVTDTADDVEMAFTITAASRAIDHFTNRRFGQDASATVRYYTWNGMCIDGREALDIRDVQTTTGLVVAFDDGTATFPNTVTLNTDFDLYPRNAAAEGVPWTHLLMCPTPAHTLPAAPTEVSVTAKAGWTAIPSLVEVACLIQASRWFMRRDTWSGVGGADQLGNTVRVDTTKLDGDVAASLQPVRRYWGAV